MKPTSIIFLIMAAALILTGTVTCLVASNRAEKEGVQLFESINEQGDYYETRTITGSAINCATICADAADVHIIGGADTTRVETVNFSPNACKFVQSGNQVTVGDAVNLTSIMSYLSNGFEFNGLRQYFHFSRDDNRHKTIYLYISETDHINSVEIDISAGNVVIENVGKALDYKINVGMGDVTVNLDTVSEMRVNIKRGNLTFKSPMAESGKLTAELDGGNAYLEFRQSSARAIDLQASRGMITENSMQKGPTLVHTPALLEPPVTVKVICNAGNIDYVTTAIYEPLTPDATQNAAQEANGTAAQE